MKPLSKFGTEQLKPLALSSREAVMPFLAFFDTKPFPEERAESTSPLTDTNAQKNLRQPIGIQGSIPPPI